jgi:hypothetical protein
MAQIARNQHQVVPQSRGCNLKIRVRKDRSSFFKLGADSAEDLGRADIKREDGYCRNDAIFYIAQVPVAGLGASGSRFGSVAFSAAGRSVQDIGQLFGTFPAPGNAGQSALRPCFSKAARCSTSVSRTKATTGLPCLVTIREEPASTSRMQSEKVAFASATEMLFSIGAIGGKS